MLIIRNTGGIAQTNCYLVADEDARVAVLFDGPDRSAGFGSSADDYILEARDAISGRNISPRWPRRAKPHRRRAAEQPVRPRSAAERAIKMEAALRRLPFISPNRLPRLLGL